MDTLFAIHDKYIENSLDGMAIYRLIKKYAIWSCDKYKVVTDDFTIEDRQNTVPVGDLDFVGKFIDITPIEVPGCLKKFLHRRYDIIKGSAVTDDMMRTCFIKNADVLKSWNNDLDFRTVYTLSPDTHYVVSERTEFSSEYRCFVHNDEILACQNYAGDPLIFPDPNYIHDIVREYSSNDRPGAYTLDIGVREKDSFTDIIEIHPFISCGLYGFYDREIPEMLKAGFTWASRSKM